MYMLLFHRFSAVRKKERKKERKNSNYGFFLLDI